MEIILFRMAGWMADGRIVSDNNATRLCWSWKFGLSLAKKRNKKFLDGTLQNFAEPQIPTNHFLYMGKCVNFVTWIIFGHLDENIWGRFHFWGCPQFWARLHFWGCLHFWGRLHFWGPLHFWGRLHFLGHFHFEVVFTRWVDQTCFLPHQNPTWNTWDKIFECGTAQPS